MRRGLSREREGELLMLLLCLLEGWFPVLSVITVALVGALYSYTFILILSTLVLAALLAARRELGTIFDREAQKPLALSALYITLLFILVFLGMRYTSAGNTALILFLQLLFSYLYFNVFGSERLDPQHSKGALLMGAGALLMLVPHEWRFNPGDLLILAAAAIAPVANVYQRRARARVGAMTLLTYRNLAALPFVALLAFCFEPLPDSAAWREALPYLVAVSLLIYVIAKILWIEALHRISITKMSAMLAIVPLLTLLIAYGVLGEVPGIRQLLGMLPILAGGYLITRPVRSAGA